MTLIVNGKRFSVPVRHLDKAQKIAESLASLIKESPDAGVEVSLQAGAPVSAGMDSSAALLLTQKT